MLQEPPHHRAHRNPVRLAGNPRRQAAGPAHGQIHRHPRAGSLRQRIDQLHVRQGVEQAGNAACFTPGGLVHLPADQAEQLLPHTLGRGGQLLQIRLGTLPRQACEEPLHIPADRLVRRQQAEVRVASGGDFIVVARAQMRVAAVDAVLAADHQQGLAMHLHTRQTRQHPASGLFQRVHQAEVPLLVQTGAGLHAHGDLHAPGGSLLQRGHHG